MLSWSALVFSSCFMYTFKIFGEAHGINDITLTWAASIGSGLVNGFSRLAIGYLSDRVCFKQLLTILIFCFIILSATVNWLVEVKSLYFLAVLLNYFCTGGFYTILPGAVTSCFDSRFAPQIYSIILSGGFFTALTNYLITKYLLGATSYLFVFIFTMIACITSMFILLSIKSPS